MPKMKTNRSAAKRFKKTASGRFKRRRGFHGHNCSKKGPKRLRFLRQEDMVAPADERRLRGLMPYA